MRLSIDLGYWGASPRDDGPVALEADRLGFDAIWTSEAYGTDAITHRGATGRMGVVGSDEPGLHDAVDPSLAHLGGAGPVISPSQPPHAAKVHHR